MAKRRKSRRLSGRKAAGRGSYCMMMRKGKGKTSKAKTRCYTSKAALERAIKKAGALPARFDAVMYYKRG